MLFVVLLIIPSVFEIFIKRTWWNTAYFFSVFVEVKGQSSTKSQIFNFKSAAKKNKQTNSVRLI